MRHRQRLSKGVSLIEALLAMAIMAIGMLGLVGLQASLRANSDVSKQRSEAVRIAQQLVEDARGYSRIGALGGSLSYSDIDPPTLLARNPITIDSNTEFERVVTVTEFPETGDLAQSGRLASSKHLRVQVSWVDRSEITQTVEVSTILSGIPPEISASLVAQAGDSLAQLPSGRHPSIPRDATLIKVGEIHEGRYKFIPPGATTDVAWYFDGRTGSFFTNSDSAEHQLLSGYVSFAKPGTSVKEQAISPTGQAKNMSMVLNITSSGHGESPIWQCYTDAPKIFEADSIQAYVSYYCAIRKNAEGTWAGSVSIYPLPFESPAGIPSWIISSIVGSDNWIICRHTTMSTDNFEDDDGWSNIDSPSVYSNAIGRSIPHSALINQNFLAIAAGEDCPAQEPTPEDPTYINTRPHQDSTVD